MSEESEHASEGLPGVTDNTSGHGRERERAIVYVPLNSTRVTAGQLRGLGTELGVPTSSSVGDLRVMIKAKLCEMDREPSNVQDALSRNPEDTSFSLVDHSGVFLIVEPQAYQPSRIYHETHDFTTKLMVSQAVAQNSRIFSSVYQFSRIITVKLMISFTFKLRPDSKLSRMPFTWPFQVLRGFSQVHNCGTTKQDHVIIKAGIVTWIRLRPSI